MASRIGGVPADVLPQGPPAPWQRRVPTSKPGHVYFVDPASRATSLLYRACGSELLAVLPAGCEKRVSSQHPGFYEFWNPKTGQSFLDVLAPMEGGRGVDLATVQAELPQCGSADSERPLRRRRVEAGAECSHGADAGDAKDGAASSPPGPAAHGAEAQVRGADAAEVWRAGATVEVCGLAGARELNGRHGQLQEFSAVNGRWLVCIAGAGPKFVRQEKLRLVAAPEALCGNEVFCHGDWVEIWDLSMGGRLHGRRGKLQYEVEPGRWQVNLEGIGTKTLSAQVLRPASGPKEMHNGQYFPLVGMKEEGEECRTADLEAAPVLPGIDD